MGTSRLAVAAALLLTACGGEEAASTGSGGSAGAGGEGGQGGMAPGFVRPDHGPRWDGCQPGEADLEGACVPAGIPPERCGAFFEPDDDGACVPILPAAPCGPGEMAVPGETVCTPVAPCGAGPWDGIPVEANSEYVDPSFGGVSDGSPAAPWTTLGQAVTAAAPNAIVALAPGTYGGEVVVEDKPLRIWGKCPAEVILDAGADDPLRFSAQDGEVHRVTLRGLRGLRVVGASTMLVEEVWFRECGDGLVPVGLPSGSPQTTVRRCLFSENENRGINGFGGTLTVEETVIRDTNPNALSNGSQHINFSDLLNEGLASLTVRRSLLERGRRRGIEGVGVDAVFEDLVVRDMATTDDDFESAIFLTGTGFTNLLGKLDANRLYLENVGGGGIRMYDVEATIDTLVVRSSAPDPGSLEGGDGVEISTIGLAGLPSVASIRHAVIQNVQSRGVLALGAEITLEAVRIEDVAPWFSGSLGQGLLVQWSDELVVGAGAQLNGVSIARAHEAGLAIVDAPATIEGALVVDTQTRNDGSFGRGIALQEDALGPFAAVIAVDRSWVNGAHEAGLGSLGAVLTGSDLRVENVGPGNLDGGACLNHQLRLGTSPTADLVRVFAEGCDGFGALFFDVPGSLQDAHFADARAVNGQFGDGVTVVAAPVSLGAMLVADHERAGIATFGAPVSVQDVVVDCAPIALNGEIFAELPFALDNLGGNRCGCGDEERDCQVTSSGLEPPTALSD